MLELKLSVELGSSAERFGRSSVTSMVCPIGIHRWSRAFSSLRPGASDVASPTWVVRLVGENWSNDWSTLTLRPESTRIRSLAVLHPSSTT